MLFIDTVLLSHGHGRDHRTTFFVIKRDIIAFMDAIRSLCIGRHSHRDWPEKTTLHGVAVAYTLPVGMVHEAFQWSKSTDTHHVDITSLTRGYINLGECLGTCLLVLQCSSFEQQ